MALIKGNMPQPAQAAPGGEPDADDVQGAQPGAAPGAVPAQAAQPSRNPQMDYERVVMAASKLLHQQNVMQAVIQMVKAHNNPPQGLADAVIFVMRELWNASKGTMPGNVVVPAAQEVAQMIGEICQRAGLFKVTPALLKQALGIAAAKVLQQNGVDAQKAQELAKQAPAQQSFKPAMTGGG